MAQSKNSFLSALASSVTSSGTVPSAALAPEVTSSIEGAGTAVYDSASLLPISGNTAGDTAFVKSTSRLYIHSGVGWYNVAVINNTPTVQSITDDSANTTPFALNTDGTPTTITITAQDSDGDPLIYNYSADSNFAGLATLSQDANVFTITPYSQDSATTTSGTITFSVTDGINTAISGTQTFTLTFAWDVVLSNISYDSKSYNIGANADDVTFSTDGTSMYAISYTGNRIYQFTCTTPFDVSTAQSPAAEFPVGSQEADPYGLTFKPDGTKVYIVGIYNSRAYDLGTAWDITTAVYNNEVYNHSAKSTSVSGIELSSDGTQMYIQGIGTDDIYSFNLSTPWDISTATYNNYKNFSGQKNGPRFNENGTAVFSVDYAGTIHRWDLTTPWDVSTATNETSYSTSSDFSDGNLFGFCFSSDGLKLYICANQSVYQFSTT